MKRIFLLITLILTVLVSLQARVNRDGEIVIGSGTGSDYGGNLPTSTYYNYSYSQQIYLASELNSRGAVVIDRISLQYFYGTSYTRNMTVYLGHTSKTMFLDETDWVQYADLQQVFDDDVVFDNTGVDKWVDIVLDQPFVYNGNDNIVVAFDDNTGTYNNSSSKFYTHSTSSSYRSLSTSRDSEDYNPMTPTFSGSRFNYVNNIKFRAAVQSCMPPSLAVTEIHSRQVTLTFAPGSDGATTVVQYKRLADDEWTTVTESSPCTITGLTPSIDYIVRAKTDCGGGDESLYVKKNFRTPSENLSTIYVTSTGAGNYGGSSWDNAMNSVSNALQTAHDIITEHGTYPHIWVAAGTYYGDGTSADAFIMVPGVSIYGGFAGTETSVNERVKGFNVTILDGQNSQRVIYQSENFPDDKTAVIDGFTIQHGKTDYYGAGAYLRKNMTLQNCKITDNVIDKQQYSYMYGGGVYLNNAKIVDCEVCNNINNSHLSSYAEGGGVYATNYSVIENCDIHHNTSSAVGGGICSGGNSTVKNCKIRNNTVGDSGGGIRTGYYDKYVNCLIANNSACHYGGGIYSNSSEVKMINCDVVSNLLTTNSYEGGGLYLTPSTTLTNCVIWGNKRTTYNNNLYCSSGNPAISHCALIGNVQGVGNICLSANNTGGYLHPKFASPTEAGADYEGGDWTLLDGSALVNQGDNLSVADVEKDLAGNDRVRQGHVDIGVYESDFASAFEIVADEVNNRIYVKAGATGNGSSWANATPHLNLAVSAAYAMPSKPEVWVAAGTYQNDPTITNAFCMMPGINVYGGFAGNESSFESRNFNTNITILDGQNSQRVIYQMDDYTEATAAVWDGFTIQNGKGSYNGAGAYIRKFATLRNCKIKDNTSTCYYGGGVYSYYGTLENCEIFGNSLTSSSYSYAYGGGVYLEYGTMRNCDIHDNSQQHQSSYYAYGGGVAARYTATIENCRIYDNSSNGYAGGLYAYGNNSSNRVAVTNCIIEGNSATGGYSGGAYSYYSVFANCKILNNSTNDSGGGIFMNNTKLVNCLMANNFANYYGGGVYMSSGENEIVNCDIVANKINENYSGGGLYYNSYNSSVVNCVIWGNKKGTSTNNIADGSYTSNITYSAIEGGFAGIGNISLSSINVGYGLNHPKFTSPATSAGTECSDGIWTLQEGSALINKGKTEDLTLPDYDLAGNVRVQKGKVDIGAYETEYEAAFEIVATDGVIYVSDNGSGSKNGSSWGNATPYINIALTEASKMSPKPVIWMKAGTYTGETGMNNAFTMREGINVYGGFAGTETALAQRDIETNPTILDGQGMQRVLLQDQAYTEATATVWDGFTIQNGSGNFNGAGAYLYRYGTLKNCIIKNNHSTNRYGGAVCMNYGTLDNCKIFDNSLTYNSYYDSYGGGVYCENGIVKNCEIYNNTSTSSYSNSNGSCGGLYLYANSAEAKADNCYIHDNAANGSGGGVFANSNNADRLAVMTNCRVENNTGGNGGGVYSGSYTKFVNCNISNNTSNYNGGGVFASYHNVFVNCNIVNNLINKTHYDGGGVYVSNRVYLTNCVVWGNVKVSDRNQIYASGTTTVTYSAVEGGCSGAGNIALSSENSGEDMHPMFVNPTEGGGAAYRDGDWSLQNGSACINNGTIESLPEGVVMPDTDLLGNQRIQQGAVDIGAFESSYKAVIITPDANNRIYVTLEGAGEMDGSSWENATPYLQLAVNKAATFNPKSTVWVKEGTYSYTGTSVNCFTMTAGVEVYGGFAGDETEMSQRDFEVHPTTLDGGSSKRVLYQAENYTSTTATLWDGFIITNANCSSDASAVYMRDYSTLRNCKIINNVGACAVYLNGYATLENTLVADNNASSSTYASGVFMQNHSKLLNCTVANNINTNSTYACGVYLNSTNDIKVYNTIIWGNKRRGGNPSTTVAGNINDCVVDVRNSAIEGGYTGIGNIPLMSSNSGGYTYHVSFLDPEHGNYRITSNSICLKKGIDGQDIGAYQSDYQSVVNIVPDLNNVIYVSTTGAGLKDGSSWENATPYLQLAVNLANTFTPAAHIWVRSGTYYGMMAYEKSAFEMAPGVKVYGGFAGTETSLAERDFRNNVTILDGGGNRRVLHQQYDFKEATLAEWDGFTIRNGRIQNGSGAGVYMLDYSNLKNCKVLNNNAENSHAGGIFVSSDETKCDTISNCIIQGNLAGSYGGGVYSNSRCYITNCLITNNTASYGGGAYTSSYNTIENTTIANNSVTTGEGGAIYGYLPTMHNCVVWGNRKDAVSNQIYYTGNNGITITYTAIEGGGYSGVGNIALESANAGAGLNPNFMSPTNVVGSSATGGDWTLNTGSVSINKGVTEGVLVPSTDLAGNVRVINGKIDLGCYESENAGGLDIEPDANGIVYVKLDGNGNGSSWDDAVGDLQFAINRASAFNPVPAIWVAKGIYYGPEGMTNAFTMAPGVSVYGGFAGNETFVDENSDGNYDNYDARDFNNNATILDGGEMQRVLNQSSDFTASTAVVWDGFTIRNGKVEGDGAGVRMLDYSTLRNCKIVNNIVVGDHRGGGVYAYGNNSQKCLVENCFISDNKACNGGGVYGCYTFVQNCQITDNEACYNNYSAQGGGVYLTSNSRLVNCEVAKNTAYYYGGGVYANSSSIINSTIACNELTRNDNNGNGLYLSNATMTNSIVWGNTGGTGTQIYDSYGNNVSYCAIQGGFTGTSNISIEAENDGLSGNYIRFVDGEHKVFDLKENSVAVNVGNNSASVILDKDLNGKPRINNDIIDIGAYEQYCLDYRYICKTIGYGSSFTFFGDILTEPGRYTRRWLPDGHSCDSLVVLDLRVSSAIYYVTETGAGNMDGSSWENAMSDINAAILNAYNATGFDSKQVWVAAGTYTGNNDKSAFEFLAGVNVYGGFSGGETALTQRNPSANITILTSTSTYYPLLKESTAYPPTSENKALFEGFVLQSGDRVELTTNTIFKNNTTNVKVQITNGTLENVLFTNLKNTRDGLVATNSRIKDCVFTNNNMDNNNVSLIVLNNSALDTCQIFANIVKKDVISANESTITGVSIFNNTGKCGTYSNNMYGAIINAVETEINHCNILNNSTMINGFHESQIYSETYSLDGDDSHSRQYKYTIIAMRNSLIENTIIWGNTQNTVDNNFIAKDRNSEINYCAIEGSSYNGIGNIRLTEGNESGAFSPKFYNPINSAGNIINQDTYDWTLKYGSICLKQGRDGCDIGAYSSSNPRAMFLIENPVSHKVYVAPTAVGAKDGSSWNDATNNLQYAVSRANTFDPPAEVWVKEGVYTGDGVSSNAAFNIVEGVNVYGGFIGNEDFYYDVKNRDLVNHRSVLDGQGVQRVLLQNEPFDDSTKWDGFVIRNGCLSQDKILEYNSVMLNNYANNSVENEMTHLVGAGAVVLEKGVLSKIIFENNKIDFTNSSNSQYIKGAALAVAEGLIDSITIVNDTTMFRYYNDNVNSYLAAFNAKITNSKFNDNVGKIYAVGSEFRNCSIENNKADVDSDENDVKSAIFDVIGSTVVNCTFRNNNSTVISKLLADARFANTFINCDISKNKGVIIRSHTLVGGDRFINCNIISNKSRSMSSPIMISGGAFHNTVVWNNRNYCDADSDFDRNNLGKYSFNHCAVELGLDGVDQVLALAPNNNGTSTAYVYPNFVAPKGGDYDLCKGSALIDAGDNEVVTELKDIMGRDRIGDDYVDIGMIESRCLNRREYNATTMVDQYPFYGEWLTEPGTYIHRWTPSHSDCDSVVVLNLTFKRIFYVKEGGGGKKDGTTWENAFADLRIACDSTAAVDGYQTEIWVAAGLYRGDGTSVNAFTLHPNVHLYGGLTGTELADYDLSQRDIEHNVTILDGDYIQRVIYQADDCTEETPVVIDGFTIKNGFSRQDVIDGTAMYLKKYCIVRNCIITENYTNSGIGAVYIKANDINNCNKRLSINTIENCKFLANQGGYALYTENATVRNCEISGNDGIGLEIGTYTKVDGCNISGNKARGVKTMWSVANYVDEMGCDVFAMSHHDIYNTKIINNAGGVYYDRPKDKGGIGDGVFVNTVIANNSASAGDDREGGGIYKIVGKVNMYNCLVINNRAASKGGGLYGLYDEIRNTIFYGNTAGTTRNQLSDYYFYLLQTDNGMIVYAKTGHSDLNYCAVEGGYPGLANISLGNDYPLGLNGYKLKENSVCIDAGTTEGFIVPEYDLFGNSRVYGGKIDMGVFESEYTGQNLINSDANNVIYVDKVGCGKKDGSSWADATSELQMAMNFSMTMDPKPSIWMKKGTYTYENSNDWSMFSLMPGVRLYGGFAGNEDASTFNLNERDFTNNTTFLDAKSKARFIDQFSEFDENERGLIDGFTIRNGAAEQRYKDRIPSGQVMMFEDEFNGGALRLKVGVTLSNCDVYGSNANLGGALYMANTSGESSLITNCRFHENYAFEEGGALYVGRSMSFLNHPLDTIANCEISDNEADRHGGMRSYQFHIVNTSIVKNNTAMYAFDTINSSNRKNEYRNCLLWGNSSRNYANQIEGSENTYKYCAIQGGYTGEGNVNIEKYNTGDEPGAHYANMIDPDNQVYRPQDNSYFANKGNNSFVKGASDLAGKPRINNEIVDMGAYEVGCVEHEHLKVIVNEWYVFYGDTLRVSGHYQRQWTQMSGTCDSLVSLDLEVRKIWYVTVDGAGNKDGSSWANAYDDIQTAINAASVFKTDAKKQIWVAKGTYRGDGISSQAFVLKPGVAMYGGFAGTEDNGIEFSDRDLVHNVSILEGSSSQRVIGNYNAYSNFTLNENATIDGFTIQNGYTVKEGGGVYVRNYVKVQNCVIKQNQGQKGAGIYADNKCEITDCKIFGNTALAEGGGAWVKSSTFTYCEIHNNLVDNTDEKPQKLGGGIYGENATVNNCLISNNSVLTDKSYGGGMYIAQSGLPSQLLNCTVVNNFSYNQGGGVYSVNDGSNNDFINCILWGNRTNLNTQQVAVSASNVPIYVRYSAIQGGAGGLGTFNLTATNNDADLFSPKFVNPTAGAGASFTGGDWHIKENSICVNQGERLVYTIEQDLDDELRVKNGRIDIGAYETEGVNEFAVRPDSHNIIYVNKTNTTGDWSGDSWANAIPDLQLAINFAADNDGYPTIWVAKGTYTGNGWPYVDAFIGLNGIDMYGGFAGNETFGYDLANRDLVNNATILDGQNIQRTLHQASSQYFKYSLDPQHSAIYDGFTLKNGFTFRNCGANLYMIKGNVNNVVIENGHALVGLNDYWEQGVGGGGIFGYSSEITVNNSVIRNNKAGSCLGGGYYGAITFNNCLFNNNSAIIDDDYPSSDADYSGIGGAGYGSAKHYNSTIVNNLAEYNGGGVAGTSLVANSVLWGNKLVDNTVNSLETSSVTKPNYNSRTVVYSAIEGGYVGKGNITLNKDNTGTNDVNFPMFVSVTAAAGAGLYGNGDWHFQNGSVLANHGNTLYAKGEKDLDGTARVKNDSIDIGAYESNYNFDYEIVADAHHIVYVTEDGAGLKNGSSWGNATPYLQFAMERATTMDTKPVIWVAKGTYRGNGVPYYPAFILPDGINIYGSFVGDEAYDYNLAYRDFDANASTFDGQELQQIMRRDVPLSGSASELTIDGFTFIHGRSNREGGGGSFSRINILNCKFLNNSSTFSEEGGNPLVKYYGGGGVHLVTSTMKYSQVIGNTTNGIGGGVKVDNASVITNCLIKNNTSGRDGGGVYGNATFDNCEISLNTAGRDGGGLNGAVEIRNTTVVRNTAALSSDEDDPGMNGGGIKSDINAYNSIIWGNKCGTAVSNIRYTKKIDLRYTACERDIFTLDLAKMNVLLETSNTGDNIAYNYVGFINPDDGEFQLSAESSCVDVGTADPQYSTAEPKDLAGNERVRGTAIDLGCYEQTPLTCPVVTSLRVPEEDITFTTAHVTWTPGGSETAWIVYYDMVGNNNPTIIEVDSNDITITELEPNDNYYVKVRAKCSDDDMSPYCPPVYFMTECDPDAVEWENVFDTKNLLPKNNQPMVSNSTILFTWDHIEGADYYDVYLWRVDDGHGLEIPDFPCRKNLSQNYCDINLYDSYYYGYGIYPPNAHDNRFDPIIPGYLEQTDDEDIAYYAWKVVAHQDCATIETDTMYFDTALPDLHVTAMDCSYAQTGQPMTVEWTVRNDGHGPVPTGKTWTDYIILSYPIDWQSESFTSSAPESFVIAQVPNLTSLEVGESYTNNFNITVPDDMVGAVFLFVVSNWRPYQPLGLDFAQYGGVFPNPYTPSETGYPYYYMSGNNKDAGNASFKEIDGNDNFFYKAIEVDIPPIPDLIVRNVIPPYENVSGDSLTITWQLINQGGAGFENLIVTDNIFITTDTEYNSSVEQFGQFSDTLTLMRNDTITRIATFKTNERYGGKDYNFFVQTDVRNTVYESLFEHNNVSPVSVHPCTFIVPPVPDLVVDTVILSKDTVSPKEKINVTYSVRNAGYTNTGLNNNPWVSDTCGYLPPVKGKPWRDIVYITTGDTLNLSNPNTKQIGSFYNSNILWTLDELAMIADTIEDYVWCKFPQIAEPDPSANPEEWTAYWEEKELQDIRRNALRTQKLALYNNCYEKTLNVTIPADYVEDNYTIFIVSDKEDNIFEHNLKANNTCLDSLYLVQPDMEIVYLQLAPERDSVHFSVKNVGKGTALNDYINSTINYNNAEIAYGYKEIDTLRPGEIIHDIVPVDLECNFYAKNTLKLTIQADNESDYTNNVRLDTIYLNNPDFLAHNLTMSSSNINSGEKFTFDYQITNDGLIDFNDTVKVGFYLGLSPELNFITARQIGVYEVPVDLAIGQTEWFPQELTMPVDAQGIYYVYVYVNDGEEICEGANDYTDYIVSEMLNVTLSPYPDFIVTEASVPDHATAGSYVNVSYTVKNQGIRAANSTEKWVDMVYVSSSPVFDKSTATLIGAVQVNGPMDIDGTYSKMVNGQIPVEIVDNQYFYIVVDAEDKIFEYIGENNNVYQSVLVTISQYNCDLAVTEFLGQTSVNWGDAITYSYKVKNIGTNGTNADYCDAVYFSTDAAWDNSDIKLKQFRGDRLAGGQTQSGNVVVEIPYGITGDCYLLFVADNTGTVIDINLANNVNALPLDVGSSPVPDLAISDVTLVTEYPAAGQPLRIAYKVTNIGDGTTNVAWKDRIYVSRNTFANAYVAETQERTLTLAQNECYYDTTSFVIPIPQVGNFAIYIDANAEDEKGNRSFFEMNYGNNSAMQSVSLDLNAPGDLIVEEISHPYEIVAGEDMVVSWHVKNLGPNLLTGQGCSDVLYLSKDDVFDGNDILLGNIEHSIVIPNYSYEVFDYTVNISGVPEGEYFIIVYTDARNAFYEVDETNNRGVSAYPFTVSLPELKFNEPQIFNLKDLVYKDFKLNINGNINETVQINVTTPDAELGAVNNIYVKHNSVGDNMDFDFSTNGQMAGNSTVYIPATKAGYYGVSVWGYTPKGDIQEVTIEAKILPFEIISVDSDHGGNTGKVTVKLTGSKFRYDMPVKLFQYAADSTHINVIKADTLYYKNYNEVMVTFDLTGAKTGLYSIEAWNYCAGYTYLDNSFTVEEGLPANLSTNIIIPEGLRPNRYCILTLEYGNIGNTDIENPKILLRSLGGSWIGLRRGELNIHRTELNIPIGEDGEPDNILRPGKRYTISIYCYTNDELIFTTDVNNGVDYYENYKHEQNVGH